MVQASLSKPTQHCNMSHVMSLNLYLYLCLLLALVQDLVAVSMARLKQHVKAASNARGKFDTLLWAPSYNVGKFENGSDIHRVGGYSRTLDKQAAPSHRV